MIGVYGANGFIGRHMVAHLARRGAAVRAVSRRYDPDFPRIATSDVEVVTADFADQFAMAASLQEVDTVLQLISTSSPGLENSHIVADITSNVVPHVEFLQSCVSAGVRRVVFISSGGTVYGPVKALPISENHPTRPISSHGVTKLTVEHYLRLFHSMHGLQVVILRLANPFGPGQTFRKGQGLVPAILARHRQGRPVRIFGDGRATRDYLYIEDVVEAVDRALTRPDLVDTVLNVGSGEGRSIQNVIEALEAALGESIRREYAPDRQSDVRSNVLDIRRAAQVLDWHPRTQFTDGVARTVRAMATLGRS